MSDAFYLLYQLNSNFFEKPYMLKKEIYLLYFLVNYC